LLILFLFVLHEGLTIHKFRFYRRAWMIFRPWGWANYDNLEFSIWSRNRRVRNFSSAQGVHTPLFPCERVDPRFWLMKFGFGPKRIDNNYSGVRSAKIWRLWCPNGFAFENSSKFSVGLRWLFGSLARWLPWADISLCNSLWFTFLALSTTYVAIEQGCVCLGIPDGNLTCSFCHLETAWSFVRVIQIISYSSNGCDLRDYEMCHKSCGVSNWHRGIGELMRKRKSRANRHITRDVDRPERPYV
jgi:hypothetical protein